MERHRTRLARASLLGAMAAGTLLLAPGPSRAEGNSPASGGAPGAAQPAAGANTPGETHAVKPALKPAVPEPAPAKGPDVVSLLIAAAVAALVGGGTAYAVVRFAGPKGAGSDPGGGGGDAPAWGDFEYFRGDVLDTLKNIRGKASNLDSVSKLQVQDWIKSLARCRADLERAPLSRGDHEPLRQLWVDVSKMGQEMSDRARKSAHGEELAGALYTFTQALSRRMQDAGKAEPGAAGAGDSGAVKKEVRRLEEQLDRGNAGITEELKRQASRIQALENAPSPSLGKLVEDEFRSLCESRADELERQLAGVQRSAAAPRVIPPVVAKSMQVADAALRVSEEALKARGLDPGVKAQLTNLGTLASTLQAMCPVSADQSKPPSVASLRSLPDRAEARWQAEIVARGGSIINGITAYWSEVNRLLQAESARIEQYLGGAAPDSGAQEAAIGDWLGSRLLPLLDQASGALQENGPARREARIGNANNLLAAMDDLHRACEAVIKNTGLEPRMARAGDIQRPEAGVKIEHASGGGAPDAILEVRQLGWSWDGRLLRELHVVVQEEGGSSGAPVTTVAAIPDESATGPRADDGAPRVKRL